MTANLERALAYLEKLPPAIDGSHGHDATWDAAFACRRMGLTDGEMWQAMCWFNENRCQPPWSEKDLRHKMANAANVQVNKPLGQSFGRRQVPRPVKADALRERMAQRGEMRKAKSAVVLAPAPAADEPSWCTAEPPEAPPPLDDSETRRIRGLAITGDSHHAADVYQPGECRPTLFCGPVGYPPVPSQEQALARLVRFIDAVKGHREQVDDAHNDGDDLDKLDYLRGPLGQHDRETIWRGGLGRMPGTGPGGLLIGWALVPTHSERT